MAVENLPIFVKTYDFILWTLGHTAKFPKSARFSVAVRLENSLLDMLQSVMTANRLRDKTARLEEADRRLEQARLLVRLSKDLRYINLSSYEYAARQMDELGRMLGGWIKQQKIVGGRG